MFRERISPEFSLGMSRCEHVKQAIGYKQRSLDQIYRFMNC